MKVGILQYCISLRELDGFLGPKDVAEETVVMLTDVMSMKCVNIWKISAPTFFQMTRL